MLFALVSAAMWAGYILLGKRVADTGDGLDSLAVGMSLAAVVLAPRPSSFPRPPSTRRFSPTPRTWLLGLCIGLLSTAIPYALDQLVFVQIGSAKFALLLALLPVTASLIGVVVLRQIPTIPEIAGIALVVVALLLSAPENRHRRAAGDSSVAAHVTAVASWRSGLAHRPSRGAADRDRAGDRLDLRRLQGGVQGPGTRRRTIASRRARRTQPERTNTSAQRQAIMRTVREHDRTDTRWLDYEIDVSKLLDYPLMTDMRDPLTQRFHRAKLRADLLRPADAGDLLDDSGAARDYLDAVEEYVTAFDVAEAEAIRKRRNDFSGRNSSVSPARTARCGSRPTPPRRRRNGNAPSTSPRRELDGLIVLPERTRAAIERGIAGELDS